MENTEPVVTSETVETPITEQVVTTENTEPSTETVETPPEKTFTQTELNDIITKRIERERESVTKKASQEARDAYIAEQGYTYNGHPIKTEAEYKQAVKDQELYDKLSEQKLPEEYIQETIENRKFREQYNQERQTNEQKAKQETEFKAFLETFPDIDPKDIPQSVWEDVTKGKSLVDAFTRHENQTLKQRLADVEKKKEIEQQNQENASSSTGSVTGNGAVVTQTFFSKKQVDAMSQSDVNKNWKAITESMKNPKFYD